MKKALLKDSVKEIKNTYKRFISILLMAFLGVGFFAGIRATSPDMVDTIDQYYDNQNVYDIQIMSTLGLTDEDIEALSKIENVETVEGNYETDGMIHIDNKEIVTRVISLGEENKPVLIEGNLPQNNNECLIEQNFLEQNDKKIGDIITLDIENTTNDEGEEVEYLKEKDLKIVGTVQSPLYISRDRGTSELGAGKVDYYIYINRDNVNASDVYSVAYIKVANATEYVTSSDKYEEYIDSVKENIEEIKEERENNRREELIERSTLKVAEAEEELNSKREEGQNQIDDAERELEEARKKIQASEREISENEETVNAEFANAKKELDDAKEQITIAEQELANQESEANTKFAQLETQKQELQNNLDSVNTGIKQYEVSYAQVQEALKAEDLTESEKQLLETQKIELEKQIDSLKQNKKTIENGIIQIDSGIAAGKQELENAKYQLNTAKEELNKNEKEYNDTKESTYSKLNQAKEELASGQEELENGGIELNQKKQEFEDTISQAEEKLRDSKEKILEIENPTWYILDRNSNAGYVSFIQDTESIENIGRVFPVVFFIVATLISLTSMTRMVEEQRMQIGTLKALGYNQLQITSKYIIYASLACVIGGILGMSLGFILLPKIIWMMYELMYQITDISISFNLEYGGIGLLLICVCILGATIYTVLKELINAPATLMRPKAPKSGNRVLLEKIPFIWNKLNFSQKVTVRNIFRYKKRFYMTVIGILGSTALILTGFGIKDSIKKIIPNQFENVFMYDIQITLKDSLNENEIETVTSKLLENDKIEDIAKVYMISGSAKNGDHSEDVQIIIPEDNEELDGIIGINDVDSKEKIELTENEICLTDKTAQLLEVQQGDTLILKNNNDQEIEIKISNVVENYVNHYVLMTKETYENFYKEDYYTNVILAKNIELSSEEEEELVSEIMDYSEVSSITNIESLVENIEDSMSLLDYVVVVLIVSAGLLAFVVLYNLANVNISERIRELATIKVLGFYDNEVYNYVAKETIILTIIGILLGLGGGYFLTYYIIGTCEINTLRFVKVVEPISYLYAAAITILFTIIVNIATYFSLKKINMIESLKSVE